MTDVCLEARSRCHAATTRYPISLPFHFYQEKSYGNVLFSIGFAKEREKKKLHSVFEKSVSVTRSCE